MGYTDLVIKQFRSENEGIMYMQTKLKKRKTMKSLLETGGGAGAHRMKEEHVMDEI